MSTTNPMSSGYEVESAAFHAPVGVDHQLEAHRSGFRGRLDGWKAKGLSRVQTMKTSLADRRASVRTNVNGQVGRVQTSMKTNPMLWAGIAAGSGFAIGLAGRLVQWRNRRRRATPDLVIIDATC